MLFVRYRNVWGRFGCSLLVGFKQKEQKKKGNKHGPDFLNGPRIWSSPMAGCCWVFGGLLLGGFRWWAGVWIKGPFRLIKLIMLSKINED